MRRQRHSPSQSLKISPIAHYKNQDSKTSVGEYVEKKDPYAPLVGIQTGEATGEDSMEVPQKVENRATI